MSDYTPTTEEVRKAYGWWTGTIDEAEETAEFDRWLANYEQEIRADERAKIAKERNDPTKPWYRCDDCDWELEDDLTKWSRCSMCGGENFTFKTKDSDEGENLMSGENK